ncbi:MAG: 7tm Odorant receptor [Desulfurococcus sp.]|nr:7tm Odorant receptor [Desulfurococcus sp.]
MFLTLIIVLSAMLSILVSLLVKAVRSHPYFAEAVKAFTSIQVPEKPRSKGDIRRLRKYRALYKSVRKRIILLLALNFTVFTLVYVLMIVLVTVLSGGEAWITIPVAIPLLSYASNGVYMTHVYVVALLGFIIPFRLISKNARL